VRSSLQWLARCLAVIPIVHHAIMPTCGFWSYVNPSSGASLPEKKDQYAPDNEIPSPPSAGTRTRTESREEGTRGGGKKRRETGEKVSLITFSP